MKKVSHKIPAVFLACWLALSLILFPAAPVYAEGGNRTVRVGFFEYPGYHEFDGNVRSGYGVDFLMLLRRYTSLNYEFVGYDKSWEEMQQMLLSGEIDLVTSARKTAQREELFDFSEPIGTNSAQINVRIDDERFIPGDFTALNGITIGEITGNSRNADVERFAEEKGFSYRVREYATAAELELALQNQEVDAAASSSLRKTDGEKTVAEFAPEDFYVIVRKGDAELLNEINYGIAQMDVNEGNWRDDLHYKNYRSTVSGILTFSRREQAYIRAVQAGEKTVTAAARPDQDPYSFVENGRLTGIVPDYFAHLMEMAGLPYTVLVAQDREEYEAWLANGYPDIIMDCRYDAASSAQGEFGLTTEPYLQLTTSRVTRRGFTGAVRSVAAAGSQSADDIGDGLAADVEVLSFASREEALRAVRDGKADACYVDTFTADRYINADPGSNLQAAIMDGPLVYECVCISPNSDHELCSILNKCIKADSSGTLNTYVKAYTTVALESLSFIQYLKLHPQLILIGAAVILVVILLIGAAVFRIRTTNLKNEQLTEGLERLNQVKGLASQFSVLYLVNLDTLESENNYLDADGTPEEAKANDAESENFFEAFRNSMVMYAHPDYRDELLKFAEPAYVREVLKNKRRYEFNFLCMNASGGYAWTDMVLMKFSEQETDEPVHIAVGYLDTDAETRKTLEEYQRQERDLEAIRGLANEYDTLYFVDLSSDLYSTYYMTEDSPDAAKAILDQGLPFSQFHRDSMKAFCHPDDLDFMLRFADADDVREMLRGQSKVTHRFLCNSDKGYQWCEFAVIRLDDGEEPERVAVAYTNIHETVEKELKQQRALTDALAASEAASRAKTEFLFNMSHDIRTPMNAILGYTDIAMRHSGEPEKVHDSLQKIKTSGTHLLRLINDILEMSRIEAGKLEIVNAPLNVYEVTEGITGMSRALAETKDITFIPVIGELKNPYVHADELHTNQVIINLISNAIKYTNPGGTVEYRVEQISGPADGIADYRITVKDNGIGMSEEFQTHLFESFAREQSASVSRQEGAGLGLAIVKRIVDLIGGTIGVQSKKNEGSTFTVELPLKVMDAAAIERWRADRAGAGEAVPDARLEGRNVLLVEDNAMNREIATELLEENGMIVDTAADGAIAVRTIAEKGAGFYDFILMDIQMPVMNGYEATAEIRKLPDGGKIPIIALSANAFEEDKQKSLAAGMNDHVAKPISIEELLGALKKYL